MFGGLPTLARVKQPLFDVTASLSLACDLAHGAEPERQLKVAVLAARMAEECGLSNEERSNAFDAGILRWLGCTATAPALSAWMGDEIAAHRRAARFSRALARKSRALARTSRALGESSRLI